VIESDEVR